MLVCLQYNGITHDERHRQHDKLSLVEVTKKRYAGYKYFFTLNKGSTSENTQTLDKRSFENTRMLQFPAHYCPLHGWDVAYMVSTGDSFNKEQKDIQCILCYTWARLRQVDILISRCTVSPYFQAMFDFSCHSLFGVFTGFSIWNYVFLLQYDNR